MSVILHHLSVAHKVEEIAWNEVVHIVCKPAVRIEWAFALPSGQADTCSIFAGSQACSGSAQAASMV